MGSEEEYMLDVDPAKRPLTSIEQDHFREEPHVPEETQPHSNRRRTSVMQVVSCKSPGAGLKRKIHLNEGPLAIICRWIIAHQIGLSANLLLLHALTHLCFPRARQSTRKFHQLSYYNPTTGGYGIGWDDIYMVWYSIIVLTGLRAAAMDYVLVPLAQRGGVRTKKGKVRFTEQGWVLIYDTTMFSLGMYIMYTHEHWMNMKEMWTGWPNREVDASTKWYYIVQFAFWVQQILVVNIEERRKDHWQMLTHHFITCILMLTSYCYHQTKVGNVILNLMEVVDLLLAFAKILKYLHYQVACDIAFGVFVVGWFVARHVLFLKVVYSVYDDSMTQTSCGCYSGSNDNLTGPFEVDCWPHLLEPLTNPSGVVCWDEHISMMFVYALLALQVVLCIWFSMIVKVAVKVIRGGEAIDSRSDDEDAADAEEEGTQENVPQAYSLPPLEEEVGVESINLSTQRHSPSRKFRKSGAHASGVTLHSDRKELLGRIGCDKMGED